MRRLKLIVFLSLFSGITMFASGPMTKFTDNALLRDANISILVMDLNSGATLHRSNANKSIMPASTMKLVTSATALEMLGPDFRFETGIEIDGRITSDSTLFGNIFIRGGGDPTLGSEFAGDPAFLEQWAAEIKKAGIKTITGRIFADESIYTSEAINPKWTWEDMGNYYAPGVYGLSYKDNTYRIFLKSEQAGSKPLIVRTEPEIKGLTFENELRANKITYDSAYLYGMPRSNFRIIRGAIPENKDEFIVKGDIPDPASVLILDLEQYLKLSGIVINNLFIPESSRRQIFTHYSPPLIEIISIINTRSNNHYAEHIFRYLSEKNGGKDSFSASSATVKNFWKSRSLPVDQLFMVDGSGLSPSNAVSAQFMVNLLEYMYKKSNFSKAFTNSLPVSGVNGTLSSFLRNTKLRGKVMAKSGTISRVKCYAGYIDYNGKKRVFAIMVNNGNGSSRAVTRKIEEFLIDISK